MSARKFSLPSLPGGREPLELCEWLTRAFALDADHPITDAVHGTGGADGYIRLNRRGAKPMRFEPAKTISVPMRLRAERPWQTIATDQPTPPYTAADCTAIADVIGWLCRAEREENQREEILGVVGVFMAGADEVQGYTTYGRGPERAEAVGALRPRGAAPHYLIDRNTGEIVIRADDLASSARHQ